MVSPTECVIKSLILPIRWVGAKRKKTQNLNVVLIFISFINMRLCNFHVCISLSVTTCLFFLSVFLLGQRSFPSKFPDTLFTWGKLGLFLLYIDKYTRTYTHTHTFLPAYHWSFDFFPYIEGFVFICLDLSFSLMSNGSIDLHEWRGVNVTWQVYSRHLPTCLLPNPSSNNNIKNV